MAEVTTGKASAPRETGVQSLERALDILELLGESKSELGITEIAPAVGLANGTVHRLLSTLTRRGYTRQNLETRKYALGLKAHALAVEVGQRLGPLARPFLEELMEVSQESANLAELDKNFVVYVEQVPAFRMVRMFTEPGNRAYAHATGTGKILLAYQPEEVVDAIIRSTGLLRFTSHTVTDPQELKNELKEIRKQGYALDSEEMEEGVRCLAAPVFAPDGNILAAMSISGPAGRLDDRRLEELIPYIKKISQQFSEDLRISI